MVGGSRKKARGFSLLELCFVLLILAILMGMTFMNLRGSVDREGPRGLAHALAADLRAARSEAQKSGRLVAVCFPSDNHTNSLSQGFTLRKGDQRGKFYRNISYGSEFGATIFLGQWESTAAPLISGTLPDPWAVSVQNDLCIFFRPNGSAFSNDLIPVDGRFPILVASKMSGTTNGPSARLSQVTDPHTVWVSSSGTVEVEENRVPVGELPLGGSELAAAQPKIDTEPPASGPELISAAFLPLQIDDIADAGIGQNFVCIHPDQKEGQYLEYGLATIELKVKDSSGGPLHYTLSATSTSDDAGEFTVPDRKGVFRYVLDKATNQYLWYALISWRPPPAAPEDTTYELTVNVTDPEGNVLEVSSGASLLPSVSTLPPARIVMCSTDDQLYLTNLDGANDILITKDGPENTPFFSADGSHVFSLYDDGSAVKELRRRTADGNHRFKALSSLPWDTTTIRFDPTFTFAAIATPSGFREFPWGRVDEESEDEDEDGSGGGTTYTYVDGLGGKELFKIVIVNLMSNDVINVTNDAEGNLEWNMLQRHTFYFTNIVETPLVTDIHAPAPFHTEPGFQDDALHLKLDGYPSYMIPASGAKKSAYGKVFNPADRNWYLEVESNKLYVRNEPKGVSVVVDSSGSGFENDPQTQRIPTWSADGTQVAYIKQNSGNRTVVTRSVLKADLSDALGSFPTNYSLTAGGLSTAQLSPRGEWVYFLRGTSLFRAVNGGSGPGANISAHLGKGIKSYVVSP